MEQTKQEYKETLNLPQTTLEMRANAINKEPQTQKFWEDNNIYQKINENKDKTNSFVLHDGYSTNYNHRQILPAISQNCHRSGRACHG